MKLFQKKIINNITQNATFKVLSTVKWLNLFLLYLTHISRTLSLELTFGSNNIKYDGKIMIKDNCLQVKNIFLFILLFLYIHSKCWSDSHEDA